MFDVLKCIGVESFVQIFVDVGVDVCFLNFGMFEMYFVVVFDMNLQMCCVLGLFEGVVIGVVDGYGCMKGLLVVMLLYFGLGFGNGFVNLYNVKKVCMFFVNVVGDYVMYYQKYDVFFFFDVVGIVGFILGWVKFFLLVDDVVVDGVFVVQVVMMFLGQVVILIFFVDMVWNFIEVIVIFFVFFDLKFFDEVCVSVVVEVFGMGELVVFLINGLLMVECMVFVDCIVQKMGVWFVMDIFVLCIECGVGCVNVDCLFYFGEQVVEVFVGMKYLILISMQLFVIFFVYFEKLNWLMFEGCELYMLVECEEDVVGVFEVLVDWVGVSDVEVNFVVLVCFELLMGVFDLCFIGVVVGYFLLENVIVVDEGGMFGVGLYFGLFGVLLYDWFILIGGFIGYGMLLVVGVVVVCFDCCVVNLQVDGLVMYIVQLFWM